MQNITKSNKLITQQQQYRNPQTQNQAATKETHNHSSKSRLIQQTI